MVKTRKELIDNSSTPKDGLKSNASSFIFLTILLEWFLTKIILSLSELIFSKKAEGPQDEPSA